MARRAVNDRPSARGPSRGRRSGRGNLREEDEVPEVYREMLAEAEAREAYVPENDRPKKRQRIDTRDTISNKPPFKDDSPQLPTASESEGRQVQTAYDSTTSDESDAEWEDVEIQQDSGIQQMAVGPSADDEPLQITLTHGDGSKGKTLSKRKLISAVQKRLRLDVHKVHLLCLLGHVHQRNTYCNDESVQGSLKRILPRRIINLINPSDDKDQFTKSTMFIDGLNQAGDVFNRRFKVTKSGLKRPHWVSDSHLLDQKARSIISSAEVILSKDDFVNQAKSLQGSRDLGAQLFCALLRSTGVEARLVCSLQPLPFSGEVKDEAASDAESQPIVISSDDHGSSTDERSRSNSPSAPPRIRRLNQPRFKALRRSQAAPRLGKFFLASLVHSDVFQEKYLQNSRDEPPGVTIPCILGGGFQ